HNTRDGLHIASLAGSWIALVAGFGGLRERGDALAFTPSLPPALTRLAFTIAYQNRRLHVAVTPKSVSYQLRSGEPLQIIHQQQTVTVSTDKPVTCTLDRRPQLTPPTQPAGRAPALRRVSDRTS
ncbi:MAG: glycosyl hydrolase family 65 protein, partial [Nakamurella sp.]